jgi:antitoxin component HigA of HigAB toxin-antitoxin module
MEGTDMTALKVGGRRERLPGQFADLVREMPPSAIADEAQHESTVEMIDRLMASGRLTRGQALYLETLVQLVQAYEASHNPVGRPRDGGIGLLRHLLDENDLSASDLGRLLGVHPSMGSKILSGERSLTVDHVKTLGARFRVSPGAFLE